MKKHFIASHNKRREFYHEQANKTLVPLKHSVGLEKQSKKIAEFLAFRSPACVLQHCIFLPKTVQKRLKVDCSYGENLFVRYGGKKPNAEDALTAWVEKEEPFFLSVNASYKNAGHFSAVLWRPTKYVGCHLTTNAASSCHVTVCTYAKPGNCGSVQGERIFQLYEDDSECEPFCPPEGCF
jgi:hypothetical protein